MSSTFADQLLAAADEGYLALPEWPEWDPGWTNILGRPVTDAYQGWQGLCQQFAEAEPELSHPIDLADPTAVAEARRIRLDLAEALERFAAQETYQQAAIWISSADVITDRPHRAAWFAFWRDLAALSQTVALQLRRQAEQLSEAAPEATRPALPPWPPSQTPAGPPSQDSASWIILAALIFAASRSRRP